MGVGDELHERLGRRIRYLARLGLQQTERRPWIWPLLGAALIGSWALLASLEATQGEPTATLDDAYIHFQFAKGFARLAPLVYSPGDAPVAGATSLLWPLLLAPLYALGFRDAALLWPAWILSFVCLGLLAYESARAAERLLSREAAVAAGMMVLGFGGLVWSAGSGMEIVPFAWLLMRGGRRLADWLDGGASGARERRELIAYGWLAPALRPEGVLLSLLLAAGLALAPRGRSRWLSLLIVPGMALPALVNWLFTGAAGSTTTEVKWLFSSAHGDVAQALTTTLANVRYLFGTLLDGEQHSALIVPRGSGPVAWLTLPALLWAGHRRGLRARALVLSALALMMLVPCSYDTFLWNRLRYLWPFAPAWFIGAGAVADAAGALLGRLVPALPAPRTLLAGGFAGAVLAYLPFTIADLAEHASGIQRQQVSLGRWAKKALPPDARIGINDAGAIAYYSERKTFDIVGLTSAGEGPHWLAGPGARFEHYERLAAERLPTHWIVYPEWHGIPQLFGAWLTERTVTDSRILGGTRMVAYEASAAGLHSAEHPPLAGKTIRDRLDVADLASEAQHRYRSAPAGTGNAWVYESGARVDGGRAGRRTESFDLKIGPGALVARVVSDQPLSLNVSCAGRRLGTLRTASAGWEELVLELPADVPSGLQRIEVVAAPADELDSASAGPEAAEPSFAALHYWTVH